MDNSQNISDFFKQLEHKILDRSFEEGLLSLLNKINSNLENYTKQCLELEEKKFLEGFIAVHKISKLLDDAVQKRTVESWIEEKLFPVIKVKKIRVVKRCDFYEFIESHKIDKVKN
jgi:hypothetical protein